MSNEVVMMMLVLQCEKKTNAIVTFFYLSSNTFRIPFIILFFECNTSVAMENDEKAIAFIILKNTVWCLSNWQNVISRTNIFGNQFAMLYE